MYTHSIHYAVILNNKDLIFILTDINIQDCKAEQNTYYVNPSIHNISCLIDYIINHLNILQMYLLFFLKITGNLGFVPAPQNHLITSAQFLTL